MCRDDVPCDEPFAAGFVVLRAGQPVARFRSDSTGHFEVRPTPGAYEVMPDARSPIPSPELQRRPVTVAAAGLTRVELLFDTLIR